MISPNMIVDGLTWREVTGPGTKYRKERNSIYCIDVDLPGGSPPVILTVNL